MGACGCKPVMPLVHVPLPATLGEFDRFAQENTFLCVEYLNEIRLADVSNPPEAQRLCGTYSVEVVAKSGKRTEVVVKDVAEEVQLVHRLLLKQRTKGKKFKPVGDVRRESCLCAANLRLLKKAPLTFTDSVIADFVNAQMALPFMLVHITILSDVFNKINRSRSGVVGVTELTEWASRRSPSIMYSVFMFVFAEVVTSQRLHYLNVVEMIAAVDRYCIMNEDQLLRTVFEILADTHNGIGSRALDITSVMNRFPVPASESAQYLSMPLLKALSKLYTKRLGMPEFAEGEPHLLTWEDFQRLSHTAAPAFEQLWSFQRLLRKTTLGHHVWNRRRRAIEKLHEEGHSMAPLKGTLVKTFYLRPRRDVQSYYTVCPLGGKSEELDRGAGSEGEGSDVEMSSRSLNSARSRDSHDSPSSRRRRHNSGAGSVVSATTPRSRGGRERYHSPAELSPRATKEFENVLKSTYSTRENRSTRHSRESSRGGAADRYRPTSTGPASSGRRTHRSNYRRDHDRLSSPSSASYDGPAQDRSPRAVSPLMVSKPPVQVPQVPLPMGPPPGGMSQSPGLPGPGPFGMPGAQPPTMMYAHAGGVPPATFHMGHNPYGPATHVPTPEMMYQQGPPRANSYSGPSFPHPNAASSIFQQRSSLPVGPPPPAAHYYF